MNRQWRIFPPIAAAVAILSVGVFFGCGNPAAEKDVVARVGDRVLTQEDLLGGIPPSARETVGRNTALNLIKEWVNAEALAQEARRLKLDTLPEIKRRLQLFEHLLLSEELRRSYFESSGDRDREAQERLFQQYIEEVKLRTPIAIIPENIPHPLREKQ